VPSIEIHPEIRQALSSGKPIVALESAAITCGLPRRPYPLPSALRAMAPQWNDSQPLNLEIGRAMTHAVRDNGAVPAIIAVIDGVLCIGLDDSDLTRLAADEGRGKASSTDLAAVMSAGQTAGTTVSGTLAGCAAARSPLTSSSARPALSVFATGGIGGVHRGWSAHLDISADLRAIASTPTCVVSAGAKSILDLPATLEILQTLGVPVVGYGTGWFPQFYCTGEPASAGSSLLGLSHRVNDPQSAAQLCRTHWHTLKQSTGVLLCNPIPQEFALDAAEMDRAVAQAEAVASARGIAGPQRTPFLLNELERLTQGRSLIANVALLLNNASLAAKVAAKLT
jgi:pseudouridylate synthase